MAEGNNYLQQESDARFRFHVEMRYVFALDCVNKVKEKLNEPLPQSWIEFYKRELSKNEEHLTLMAEAYFREFGQYPVGYKQNG